MAIEIEETITRTYDLEYIRIDGDRIGTQVCDVNDKAKQLQCKGMVLSDLPQAAQDAYGVFSAAVLDVVLETNETCKDVLKIKDKAKYDELYADKDKDKDKDK